MLKETKIWTTEKLTKLKTDMKLTLKKTQGELWHHTINGKNRPKTTIGCCRQVMYMFKLHMVKLILLSVIQRCRDEQSTFPKSLSTYFNIPPMEILIVM